MKPDRAGQAWLDALPDAIVAIDHEGRLEWANKAASSLFGWELVDFSGRSVMDLIHPDDLHFALMSLDTVQTKDVGTAIEVRVQTDGGWKLVEVVGCIEGIEVAVNASVGVTYTRPGDTKTGVLVRADRAMYQLKAGRTRRAS